MSKPEITVAAGIILRGAREIPEVLLTRRKENAHLGGYWEFPGGKIRPGESLEECLKRELHEELGVEAQIKRPILSTSYEYPGKIVHLHFYLCDILSGFPRPREAEELAWVSVGDLAGYQLPPADQELVAQLNQGSSLET